VHTLLLFRGNPAVLQFQVSSVNF